MTVARHDRPPGARERLRRGTVYLGGVLRGVLAAVVLVALLVGLPWALTRFVGWPLPGHPPSWAEIEGVLLGPMSTGFLVDFLACTAWLVWALFALDAARCAIDIVRDARLPSPAAAAGPVRRVAAVLVGATLISILGHRATAITPRPPSAGPGTGSYVVAAAPAWQHPSDRNTADVRPAVHAASRHAASATVDRPVPVRSVVAAAPDPVTGVHDSLWRIAQRTLGDGDRWPEIWELNKGKPQPGGGTFTRPSLIFPGEEFTLPAGATMPTTLSEHHLPQPLPAPPPPPATPTQPSGSPVTPAPSTRQAPPSTPPSTTPAASSSTETTPEPGFHWGEELFVGLGLASVVSTVLMTARRRHNGRYRPGSGDRTDLPVAPVVYQLRLAHLRAEQDDDGLAESGERVPPSVPFVVGVSGTDSRERPMFAPELGVRDGREIALDLAASRGVGLVGAGATASVRALVVATLTGRPKHPATGPPGTRARVFVPAADLSWMLGHGARHVRLPAALRVVADLDAALDALEAETLVRAGTDRDQDTALRSWPPLVLVARPLEYRRQRLQAALDNGAPFGITGILLGQWQPGVTAYIREDGTVSATDPGLGEALRGTRMFHLGAEHAAELLALLHQAQPDTPDGVQPPVPHPRGMSVDPAGHRRTVPPRAGPPTTSGTDDGDTDPEHDTGPAVTTAVAAVVPVNTDLEILGSRRSTTSAVRPRPAAVPTPQPTAPPPVKAPEVLGSSAGEPVPTGGHFLTTATDPSTDTAAEISWAPPIAVTVLGALRVHWNSEPDTADPDRRSREITGELQPRTRELLVLLALYPDGTTRDTLVSALWGQDPPARPTNALHTALSRMRHALTAATDGRVTTIVMVGNGRYQLDPTKVTVDYWRFADAVAARRAATTDQARVHAYRQVVDSYGGPLADGMSTEWIEPAREAIRRDAIDAVAALARALVESDPQRTLDLLEVARTFDPHNELLYRDIMRLQERLGQLDAIPRTLGLLATRLAEVDETPTPQARALAAGLGRRRDGTIPTAPTTTASGDNRGHGRDAAG